MLLEQISKFVFGYFRKENQQAIVNVNQTYLLTLENKTTQQSIREIVESLADTPLKKLIVAMVFLHQISFECINFINVLIFK